MHTRIGSHHLLILALRHLTLTDPTTNIKPAKIRHRDQNHSDGISDREKWGCPRRDGGVGRLGRRRLDKRGWLWDGWRHVGKCHEQMVRIAGLTVRNR